MASVCLYDNMKVVVLHWDGEDPVYNTRFLAFAAHYGFRPWACKRRRPRTKGKVERPFFHIETNLFNGRDFASLDHLNGFTQDIWLPQVDQRRHDTTGRPPLEMWEEEKTHLVPLPEHDYDTAEVFYRSIGPGWHVPYKGNWYSVPWQRIGQLLPIRATAQHLIVYSPDVREIARHELLPPGLGQKQTLACHAPGADEKRRHELLQERFAALGASGARFLDEIVRTRRYGKDEAHRVLALLAIYERVDLLAALDRACRYRAFSLTAVERILSAQARPKSTLASLTLEAQDQIDDVLRREPVPPRSASEYQSLLDEAQSDHGQEPEDNPA